MYAPNSDHKIHVDYLFQDGNIFQDAVFNETINIVDADEGLDGET